MSWFDEEQIERLREVYNKEHKHETPIAKGDTEKVWEELRRRLQAKCKTGRAECILGSLMQKPKAPEEWSVNRYEWLSSDDIDDVEKNYKKLFPGYYYVGSLPMDFDLKSETRECLVSSICSMKLPKLVEKGYDRIGIVINTDPHDGPGQHWVAVYADLRPELEYPRMTYFDSYAHKPEPEIVKLMERWSTQWNETKKHSKPMELTYNKIRHQYKTSECGMYCLYFHYCCLTELPMGERVPDEVINGFRGLLFRIPNIKSKDKE